MHLRRRNIERHNPTFVGSGRQVIVENNTAIYADPDLMARAAGTHDRRDPRAAGGRWLTGQEGDRDLPLISVFAMTDDFEAAVLTGKNDRDDIPVKLRAKQSPEWDETAAFAEAGMRRIEHDMVLLAPPDDAELDRAYTALKMLHADAFGWSPPDVTGLERLVATRMRQYVRAWINEWDLPRLDPSFRPQSVAVDIASDYREDSALEAGSLSYEDSREA